MRVFCYTENMTKIFITRKIPEICVTMLKEKGFKVDVSKKNRTLTKKELVNILNKNKYDGVVTLLTDKIDKEFLNSLETVKIIANYAVGLNNIDLKEAERLNIFIANARGTSAKAVAQHVVALTLAVADRIIEGDYAVRKQKWKGWLPNFLIGKDVYGKTFGLIGSGNIGQKAAETFTLGFGCKILYTDLNENKELEEKYGATRLDLEGVLRKSDIVSLHVPLTKETKHLINSKNLNKMKPNAILINTARGPVVDEKALTLALIKRKIAGAGLDVFEFEPKVGKTLRNLPNVVLSPHIGSAKESARIEMAVSTATNIINFFSKTK